MIETILKKHKLNKWYYFIPVIGSMIYSIIFEFAINKLVIDGQKEFKIIKKYRSIANLIVLSISLAFIITFFVIRNKNGNGSWPWPFWTGLGIGLSTNALPFLWWFLYKKGIERYKKTEKPE